ncbi:hypothetical protein [Poriferisphaera sp. WC338]|uniref:hypothetical protein n=1 Tax=Poriferisphaera sp. WC338 TaxID=3425129 RepID=UPI003D81A191
MTKTILILVTLLSITTLTHAAPTPIFYSPTEASGINGILVGGVTYNATFHSFHQGTATSFTFNQIWDPNGDMDFSDSTTDDPPAFWENETAAVTAATQIFIALETYGLTIYFNHGSDAFAIPYQFDDADPEFILATGDAAIAPSIDTIISDAHIHSSSIFLPTPVPSGPVATYVSFTVVPEPTSLAFLALTSLPLFTRIRRK